MKEMKKCMGAAHDMAAANNDNWIRRFEVTDAKRHKNGFTIYKVTSVVFPRSAPEASTSVVVWKRYNDFKKLYKTLQHYCNHYNINEKLPQLYEGKYFNRFEENIIDERIKFSLELLNFIGRHKILFTSDPFLQFFNSGYNTEEVKVENYVAGSSMGCPIDRNEDIDIKGRFSGVWDPKSSHESVSVSCECSDDDSASTNVFEPLNSGHSTLSSVFNKDDSNQFDSNHTLDVALDVAKFPSYLIDEKMMQVENNSGKSVLILPNGCQTVTCRTEKPTQPIMTFVSSKIHSQDDTSLSASTDLPEKWITPPATPDVKSASQPDYLVEAAFHIGHAQKCEADGEFESAAYSYKEAVGVLLNGAENDEETFRREAVREKAKLYLQRAEKINSLHLARSNANESEKLSNSIEELNTFKVLNVIDSVMLVLNMCDNRCYIIKVLQKSPCPVDTKKKTTLPYKVPYMVKLYKYYENENSIFLVLEYARGGRLWDCISRKTSNANYDSTKDDFDCSPRFPSCDIKEASFNESEEAPDVWPRLELNEKCSKEFSEKHSPLESIKTLNENGERSLIMESHHEIKTIEAENLEIASLLQNSQKLLNSVNKTLENSEKISNNISKELIDIEKAFNLNCRLLSAEKTDLKSKRKRSRSAVLKLRREKCFSLEDLSESRPRTASSSLDRRNEWSRIASVADSGPDVSESEIRNWAAQILVALDTLHRYGIICKDLQPKNILLGERGNILLTFQANWKGVDSPISEEAIAGFYAAPESTSVFPITPAVDWWSFGALLHELFTGKTLASCYPEGILGHTVLTFPEYMSPEACSLLTELLRYEAGERLGSGVNGAEDIKCHPFFSYVDWQSLYETC